MYRDPYGLRLSSSSSAAAEAYSAALLSAMSLDRSGIPELTAAIECDPEFALAHWLLARQHTIYGNRGSVAKHVELAERYAARCPMQERGVLRVGVAALTHDGDALDLALEHLRSYPRDVPVLMQVVGPFGLLAFSGLNDWRERNVELVEAVADRFSADDWWFEAAAGFSYAEVGLLAKAERHAETAWQQKPNGATGHALSHVHIEQGAVAGGIRFLEEWQRNFANVSDMRHHMRWHCALLKLESNGAESVLEDYRRGLEQSAEGAPPLDVLSDDASLLWRLKLRGVEVAGEFWEALAEFAETYFAEPGFVFADLHRVIVHAALGGNEGAEMEASERWQDPLPVLSRAFDAFAKSDYDKAVEELETAVDAALHVGGSNPQRAVVRETYDEALRRAASSA